MNARAITPWPPRAELICGEFRRGARYTNWRPRGSGDWLLIYTVAGSGRIVSAAGSCETRAGEAVLYAPHDRQDYSTAAHAGRWHLLWVHFAPQPHWHPWLHWPIPPHGIRLLRLEAGEARTHFLAALQRMVSVARRELPGALALAGNALEEALLWANVVAAKTRWMVMDDRVRKAIEYLVLHSREPFALGTLARHCGASVSRLAFLFKDETGTSPQQFLERHRLQHASQLLRSTTLSVAEIATEIGYADPFYFSNRFRRFAGHSPSHHRANPNDPPPARLNSRSPARLPRADA